MSPNGTHDFALHLSLTEIWLRRRTGGSGWPIICPTYQPDHERCQLDLYVPTRPTQEITGNATMSQDTR